MATFTDRKGRTWDVSLDLRKARIVDKSDFKEYWDQDFSILNPQDKGLLQKLITDPSFLFAIIWALVQEQAQQKWEAYDAFQKHMEATKGQGEGNPRPDPDTFPISPKEAAAAELEFVSGINGPTIEAGRNAFMEALGDFFPDQRTALSILVQQLKTVTKKISDKLGTAVPLINDLLDKELDNLVDEMKKRLGEQPSGETSSTSPLSPGSATVTSGIPATPSNISSSPTTLPSSPSGTIPASSPPESTTSLVP